MIIGTVGGGCDGKAVGHTIPQDVSLSGIIYACDRIEEAGGTPLYLLVPITGKELAGYLRWEYLHGFRRFPAREIPGSAMLQVVVSPRLKESDWLVCDDVVPDEEIEKLLK